MPAARNHELLGASRQVAALLASVDDTLSDKAILEELKALENSGKAYRTVFADVQSGRK